MRLARERKKSILTAAVLILMPVLIIFFIPPTNWIIIFTFIALLSFLLSFFTRLLFSKKYAIAIFFANLILLTLLVLDLFDTINAILLISLFVGILALIK
jgi:hypothetical protein